MNYPQELQEGFYPSETVIPVGTLLEEGQYYLVDGKMRYCHASCPVEIMQCHWQAQGFPAKEVRNIALAERLENGK